MKKLLLLPLLCCLSGCGIDTKVTQKEDYILYEVDVDTDFIDVDIDIKFDTDELPENKLSD